MTDRKRTSDSRSVAEPSAAMRRLGATLVGKWRLTGGAEGEIRCEWAEGEFFLIQHVNLRAFGRNIKGIEMIGHLHRVGERNLSVLNVVQGPSPYFRNH